MEPTPAAILANLHALLPGSDLAGETLTLPDLKVSITLREVTQEDRLLTVEYLLGCPQWDKSLHEPFYAPGQGEEAAAKANAAMRDTLISAVRRMAAKAPAHYTLRPPSKAKPTGGGSTWATW